MVYGEVLKSQVYQVKTELLVFVKKHHKDWFDDNDDNIKGVSHIQKLFVFLC